VNLDNLFEVDWNLCTDAQAKANDHWWRALKNFKFVPKTNPAGSKLEWRRGGANCPLRSLEELAAYRFEAVRRILNLQGSAHSWPNLDSTDRLLLIDKLGKGYNPGGLYFCHDEGRPDSAVPLNSNGPILFWDVALPDDVLIHNFRILVETERRNLGISPGGKRRETTKGMTMSPPQFHLLELLDERFQRASEPRKVGRPRLDEPPNAYSNEEQRKVNNLVRDALKWAESCHCSLW
jgi:hypothetical protein